MNRRHSAELTTLLMISLISLAQAAEPYETPGKVDAVTVYRGQALVTRLIDVSGPAGLREVVITNLPGQVVAGSLFAERADGVEIRSVRYRERPVVQDVREEVAKLDSEIRTLQDTLQEKNALRPLADVNLKYLDGLSNFVAATASAEMTKNVLNPQNVSELSQFIFTERQRVIQEQIVKVDLEIRELKEKIEFLQRQRDQLAGSSARTVREAVIFANIGDEKGGQFKLQYLVNSASWSPSYNVRAGAERKEVLVEYNASIQQLSGEEWTDVAMTLSTATPSLVAGAPELEPLTIALGTPPQAPMMDAPQAKSKLLSERIQLENQRAVNAPPAPGMAGMMGADQKENAQQQMAQPMRQRSLKQFDVGLNKISKDIQVLEFVSEFKQSKEADRKSSDEGVSVTYRIDARTSLPSRADQQLIQIAAIAVPAEFYRTATPVLTDYVYEQASVKNLGETKMVLLAGPVATYLEGQFVGHGSIPTVAVGEDFTLGFGIDPSLRTKRELVEKSQDIQGGNRQVTFTYKLTLENFSSAPVAIRLSDRLPVTKSDDIKLTLVSTKPELTSQSKKGILRWDVTVPPQSMGEKAFTVEYQVRMEYDKQMTIIGLPAENQ